MREEQQVGSNSANGSPHRLALVAAEVVEYDDAVRLQRRDLFDIRTEQRAVDRALDDPERGDPIMPQGGKEGHGLPVPERNLGSLSLAFRSPAPQRSHVDFALRWPSSNASHCAAQVDLAAATFFDVRHGVRLFHSRANG